MARWRVLVGSRSFGKASPDHFARLEAAGCEVISNTTGRAYNAGELLELLPGVDAIITGTDELTRDVISAAPGLRTIAKHGVGLDSIDLAAARDHGILVTATPEAIHDSVADHTLALLLAVTRQVAQAHSSTRDGEWRNFVGMELRGKLLGLVGFGRIGREVCVRAQAFGMRVTAYDPYPNEAFAAEHDVELLPLEALLSAADVVSLHAGVADAAKPLLGAAELQSMKPGSYLINTARGHLVDEAALAERLNSGAIAGEGLDVFVEEPPVGSPLMDLPNVVLTPHIAGQTREGLLRMGDMTVENCLRALRGEQPLFVVTA